MASSGTGAGRGKNNMKKRWVIFLLSVLTLMPSMQIIAAEVTTEYQDGDSIGREEISNGTIYSEMSPVYPQAKFYKNGDTLEIDFSEVDITDGVDLFALRVMKYTARVLSYPEFRENYEGLVVGCINTDHYFMITVTDFKDLGSFYSTLTARSSNDDGLDASLESYYEDIFGHYDLEYQSNIISDFLSEGSTDMQVRLCDSFLLYSSFYENIKSYHISNDYLELSLQNGYSSSEDSGYRFGQDVRRFIDSFAEIYNCSSSILSFTSFKLSCVGDDDSELGFISLHVGEGKFETDALNCSSNDFLNGFLDGLNGEIVTDEEVTSENTSSGGTNGYENDSIMFRNIPWYSSKSEAEKILAEEGASIGTDSFKNHIRRMGGIDFINTMAGDDYIEGGGIVGNYEGITVAGYDPSEIGACYIYTLNDDGTINKNDNDAEFYFGWYAFDSRDYVDGAGVYDDLHQKLTSLYGEGIEDTESDYFNTITWYDSENNQIRLLLGGKQADYKYVTLGYMAAGADERLDKMQNALDAEAAANEAAERESNRDNVSGL